jgi:urease subunit beta
MIPGEYKYSDPDAILTGNVGLETLTLKVANKGDRPVQVGSHFHFYEINELVAMAGERRVYGLNNKVDAPLD